MSAVIVATLYSYKVAYLHALATSDWIAVQLVQVNMSKTEVLWCALDLQWHQIPYDSMMVGLDVVQPVHSLSEISQ